MDAYSTPSALVNIYPSLFIHIRTSAAAVFHPDDEETKRGRMKRRMKRTKRRGGWRGGRGGYLG
jgi:hypothetical protein